jgi:nucleotide-binding universal stress UspA family protein
MMKRILVPLTGHETDRSALEAAFTLARGFGGHVDGLFVRTDPRDAVPMLGEGMSAALVDEIMRSAETETAARARAASASFEAARGQAGAAACERPPGPGGLTASWSEATGRGDDVVPLRARLADAVVFSRAALDLDPLLLPTFETALLGAGRPVLLAPQTPVARLGETVAVAWNGGLEATRAVVAAMSLLLRAREVHVLTAATATTPADAGDRLAEYLAWQGVAAKVERVRHVAGPVGAALADRAAEIGADLLVMGAYGHSRLREMILGGVTRHMLGHAALPVLMAH